MPKNKKDLDEWKAKTFAPKTTGEIGLDDELMLLTPSELAKRARALKDEWETLDRDLQDLRARKNTVQSQFRQLQKHCQHKHEDGTDAIQLLGEPQVKTCTLCLEAEPIYELSGEPGYHPPVQPEYQRRVSFRQGDFIDSQEVQHLKRCHPDEKTQGLH